MTSFQPLLASSKSSHKSKKIAQYDYVIVGAGNAGASLAAKLSDPDPRTGKYKNSVLVLEAGVDLTKDPEVLAANILATFALEFDPKYSKVTSTQLSDFVEFPYSDGRMWGGSSAHNNLQAVRGTPGLYDQWAAISGDPRWSYNSLLNNVMIPMEHYTPDSTPLDPLQRGFNGPVFITQEPPVDGDAFMQAVSTGFDTPFSPDLNDPTYGDVGIGANQDWVTPPYGSPTSVRSFSGNSYLTGIESEGIPPIVDANGNGLGKRKLKIISNAQVSRVLFNKKNVAKSVEYILSTSREEVFTVKAKKQIILCAGTIQDAAILQRSGVGDPTLLTSLGIPVVFANPNVGANMFTHVGPQGVISNVATTVTLPRAGSGFIDLEPSTGVRRLQLFVLDSLIFFPAGIADALQIDPSTSIDIICFNITPQSHGTVEIVSRDPFFDPRVNINIYSDGPPSTPGTDASKAVAFYRELQDVADAYGGGAFVSYPPNVTTASDDELFANALFTNVTTQHLSGTCRMSQSPADGVVDGSLRVFGVKHLMCASNSVAPVIEDGNTAYQAYMIGLEAARILQE